MLYSSDYYSVARCFVRRPAFASMGSRFFRMRLPITKLVAAVPFACISATAHSATLVAHAAPGTAPPPPSWFDANTALTMAEFGQGCAEKSTITEKIMDKLCGDAPLHTLDMQARGGVGGKRLLHLAADHCQPPAKSVKLDCKAENRTMWMASSAETKSVHSLCIVPNETYDSIQTAVRDLNKRPGGPPRIFSVDNMPINEDAYMQDLKPECCTTDLKHMIGRIFKKMNSKAQPLYKEECAEIAGFFTRRRQIGPGSSS